MKGLFTEIGPCILNPASNQTSPNPYSWNNNASVIFLDQPAGTGFSSKSSKVPYTQTDLEGAVDFQTFLNVFFSKIFPDFGHLPIHMAGESYGGHYVPVYTDYIIASKLRSTESAFQGNISSIILVNGYVDPTAYNIGEYELLCKGETPLFNSTTCGEISKALPECVKQNQRCLDSYATNVCISADNFCKTNIAKYYIAEQDAGRKSPYNSKSDDINDYPLGIYPLV